MMKRLPALCLALCLLPLAAPTLASGGGGGGGSGPYLAIEPPIVVNLQTQGRLRFMQVKIQAMSNEPDTLKALQTHAAPVRHALIMLLSAQEADAMYDVQKRDQVRLQALEALRKVLEEQAGIKSEGDKGLAGLYFTDFVIQ